MDEAEFIQNIYDEADESIKPLLYEQRENRNKLLELISLVMLKYKIENSTLKMNKLEQRRELIKIKKLVESNINKEIKKTSKEVGNIITKAGKEKYSFYGSGSISEKAILDIANRKIKNQKFSVAIWNNSEAIAKDLIKEIDDFLKGKINVNQIEKRIISKYNTNGSNVKRLVTDQVGSIQADITTLRFKEMGVKKVKRNATLCNTCNTCMDLHGKIYEFGKEPYVKSHVGCHCFYTVEE